ncbi:MAG: Ni/Fe hydrogenase subunit alpha [Pseudomonadota bacterium]
MPTRKIEVKGLARVEGEGALRLRLRGGKVEIAAFDIYEPPRFFEALLRGRLVTEAPDITARICGICPVAYQMSAVHAIERAAGVELDGPLRALRRLLYCGEWIASHVLHIYMLHAPDFLGLDDAIAMARDHGAMLRQALAMKKAGNQLMAFLGGREVHPINVRVGGFYRTPTRSELVTLREPLSRGRDIARAALGWLAALPFPEGAHDYEFVALRHEADYPMNEGRVVSSQGLDIAADDFEAHFREFQVPHSTALHSAIRGRGRYLVGPLARYALNHDRLPAAVQAAAAEAGLGAICRNPFKSILVRGIEVLYAFEEALRLIDDYEEPAAPFVAVETRHLQGCAATEAPRGLLYHRYETDGDGLITAARIVPPTAQNQATIEADVAAVAAANSEEAQEKLAWRCEQAIRNHDPCISCAAHFLRLDIERP